MMHLLSNLLADEVHWEKLAPIAIVFGLWALGAISSALKKSGHAMQRRTPPPPMDPIVAAPPIRAPSTPPPMRPGPGGIMNMLREAQAIAQAEARKRADALRQSAAKQKRVSKPRVVPPRPLPLPPSVPFVPTMAATRREAEVAQPLSTQPTVASTRYGLGPRTLRQQYITMEILMPPVALREPRE